MNKFIGASVIAGLVYFALSFASGLWLEGPDATKTSAFLTALVKTAVFTALFHYLHNFAARIFGWYKVDPEMTDLNEMDI